MNCFASVNGSVTHLPLFTRINQQMPRGGVTRLVTENTVIFCACPYVCMGGGAAVAIISSMTEGIVL